MGTAMNNNGSRERGVSVKVALYETSIMFLIQVTLYSTIELVLYGLSEIRLSVSVPTAVFFAVWQYLGLRRGVI